MIHERIVESTTSGQPRVLTRLAPTKIFRLGEGAGRQFGDGSYTLHGFTRLMTSGGIGKPVAKDVQDGHFAYGNAPKPVAGRDNRYQVLSANVGSKTAVADDQMDVDSASLMLPQATPQPLRGREPPICVSGMPTGVATTTGISVPQGAMIHRELAPVAKPGAEKMVNLVFTTHGNGLFTRWNVVANLVDPAGPVQLRVHAVSEKDLDKDQIRNRDIEPLRKADLIDQGCRSPLETETVCL